jgi:hypothetical protein
MFSLKPLPVWDEWDSVNTAAYGSKGVPLTVIRTVSTNLSSSGCHCAAREECLIGTAPPLLDYDAVKAVRLVSIEQYFGEGVPAYILTCLWRDGR